MVKMANWWLMNLQEWTNENRCSRQCPLAYEAYVTSLRRKSPRYFMDFVLFIVLTRRASSGAASSVSSAFHYSLPSASSTITFESLYASSSVQLFLSLPLFLSFSTIFETRGYVKNKVREGTTTTRRSEVSKRIFSRVRTQRLCSLDAAKASNHRRVCERPHTPSGWKSPSDVSRGAIVSETRDSQFPQPKEFQEEEEEEEEEDEEAAVVDRYERRRETWPIARVHLTFCKPCQCRCQRHVSLRSSPLEHPAEPESSHDHVLRSSRGIVSSISSNLRRFRSTGFRLGKTN